MKDVFAGIPAPKVKRSKFDLSHDVKLSGDMGKIIPVLAQDVLPGESWRNTSTFMVRFAPLLAPIMHLVQVKMHFFFVPNRILYSSDDGWEKAIYGGKDGNQGLADPSIPYISIKDAIAEIHALGEDEFNLYFGVGSLWDYIGFPPIQWNANLAAYIDETEVNVLAMMAYLKVWNEYYRDQTLQDEIPINADQMDQSANITDFLVKDVCWKKDQFTSALPWPQRGAEVLIPLDLDVTYRNVSEIYKPDGTPPAASANLTTGDNVTANQNQIMLGAGNPAARIENIESISNATVTINDFRVAVVVQRWMEANARGGARENEGTLSHFGVKIPDYRLKHPEFLGGGVQTVQISENLSTANSQDAASNTVPQANMAGHGLALGNSNSFQYTCKEHGWIIGVLYVMPKAAYQDGIPRKFLKLQRFDYAWPQFVGLGEQEVQSKELYYRATQSTAANNALFGYQQRYYEYKTESDRVCGDFRTTLSYWHMGRIFSSRPFLNEAFLTSPPTKRIFAVEDVNAHSLWMVVHHNLSALRPMPYYSVPGVSKI